MLIYSFITDYQAFNLRYKDNTTRDKNETKVGKQSANLGKNNEPIQNRLSFLMDCKSVILHHLTILSFPMVRPAWDNWFMDENYAINKTRFAANLSVIRKEVSRSHDDFITEHFRKYSEPDLPPVWKTLEVISMGTLSKLYANFSDSAAKHAVAREFGLKHHKFLRSWLECLAVLRNCCAHHSRLSNRVFPVKPMMPERMPNTWITDFSFREQTLYPQLCYVVYWLNSIFTDNTFVTDFKQLLARHQSVNPHLLGFPYNWEQEPLWK